MTLATQESNEFSRLTKTSSPERAYVGAPSGAATARGQCLVIELDASRKLESTLPPKFKLPSEIVRNYESNPDRRKSLAAARAWLAKQETKEKSLRSLRLRKGLSQSALAAETGMTQAHIARLESGRVDAQVSTVMRLALALQVKPTTLFQVLAARESRDTVR